MSRSRSAQPKVLISTLLSCLWPWFLAWSVLALLVLPMKLGDAEVAKWTSHVALGTILRWIVRHFDMIWFFLACVNLYHFVIRREGLRTARLWGAVILPSVTLALWLGLRTGIPFGDFYYTRTLGFRMEGTPPVAAILLWFTLIVCCRYAAMAFFPRLQPRALAGVAAGLLVATDLLLEQVAWKVRFYWMWPSDLTPAPWMPPWQNFVAWGAIAFVLTLMTPGKPVAEGERLGRPLVILGALCGVFMIARLANL